MLKEPRYTLPTPCSRCTAFLHMASQADPRDTTSAPRGELPFKASRGGVVQSPPAVLTTDPLLLACFTPSPLSRVPWPRLPSMKYIGINHSLHFQGGSSPHIGTKTSKHKRGQNPEKEEETSYGSFLLSSLGPWHYVIYLTNGAQHYILALNLSIYITS